MTKIVEPQPRVELGLSQCNLKELLIGVAVSQQTPVERREQEICSTDCFFLPIHFHRHHRKQATREPISSASCMALGLLVMVGVVIDAA